MRGMLCPTCGAPVMVRKDSWECGYCCDCGNLPRRPEIVLTVDVEEEPKLTIGSLAENADPDTALLLRKFSETIGAWEAAKQKNTEEIPDTVPGSGSGLREDYDDLEDLHEDGNYKDLNEEQNE